MYWKPQQGEWGLGLHRTVGATETGDELEVLAEGTPVLSGR